MPTNIFGFGLGVREEPPSVNVSRENLFGSFAKGAGDYEDVLKKVIAPINLDNISNLKG